MLRRVTPLGKILDMTTQDSVWTQWEIRKPFVFWEGEMRKLQGIAGLVLAALTGLGTEALAGGFAFNENGAAATGKATAFVGEANDPSAIFYNPAGITQLPGTQVMIGASLVKLDSTFRSSTTVESTQLQDQFPVLPYVYITHRFKGWDERLSIGLVIYT